jgi:ABC-type transporter Mla subunit MlaD
MQTERVTFLTSRDQKKALDAYARRTGRSVGHVVREATARYMAHGENSEDADDDEAQLAALVEEVNNAIPKMNASLDQMSRTLRETSAEVDKVLRAAGIRK